MSKTYKPATKEERAAKAAAQIQELAKTIIDLVQGGVKSWINPNDANGKAVAYQLLAPRNGNTGKFYRGTNFVELLATMQRAHYTSPYFLTFKQAQEIKAKVLKGSHSASVNFYHERTAQEIVDYADKHNLDVTQVKQHFIIRTNVFNFNQCENVPQEQQKQPDPTWDADKAAENLLNNCQVPIYYDECKTNHQVKDEIHLFPRATFRSKHVFYSTAFHELIHSTGTEAKLNRTCYKLYANNKYRAQEELIAEIGALIMCSLFGYETSGPDENHVAYLQSWLECLKDTPKEILKATTEAQKAVDYLFKAANMDANDLQPVK